MRYYRVVRIIDDGKWRWCVVSGSLRDDQTWDVIQEFSDRDRAAAYVEEVTGRHLTLGRLP